MKLQVNLLCLKIEWSGRRVNPRCYHYLDICSVEQDP